MKREQQKLQAPKDSFASRVLFPPFSRTFVVTDISLNWIERIRMDHLNQDKPSPNLVAGAELGSFADIMVDLITPVDGTLSQLKLGGNGLHKVSAKLRNEFRKGSVTKKDAKGGDTRNANNETKKNRKSAGRKMAVSFGPVPGGRGSGEPPGNKVCPVSKDQTNQLLTMLNALVASRPIFQYADAPKLYDSMELVLNQPIMSPGGYGYHMVIPGGFRVDIGSNGCFRAYNSQFKSAAAFNPNEGSAGLITPWGRMLEETKLQIAHLSVGKRVARMNANRISFSAFGRSLAFLVDHSGCKTTNDKFRNLDTTDYTSEMLVQDAVSGKDGHNIAKKELKAIERFPSDAEVKSGWIMSGYKVVLTVSGELDVRHFSNHFSTTFYRDGQVKVKHNNISMIVRDGYASMVSLQPKKLWMCLPQRRPRLPRNSRRT